MDTIRIDQGELNQICSSSYGTKSNMLMNETPVGEVLVDQKRNLKNGAYFESTDTHQYLNFHSCHPSHTKRNIPYCMTRRICAIVSDNNIRAVRLNELKGYLTQQLYPEGLIESGIRKAKQLKPQELRTPKGETALHIAFSVGYILASEILIKHESSLDKRNNKDDIPFDAFGGHESIYRKDIRHNRKTKYKTERRLDVFKDLKIGLEVAFGRMKIARNNYIYKHHGIIINIYDISGKFEIVELTATDTTANISAAVLSKNIKPRIEKKIIKFKDDIFYYDYDSLSFSNEVIKERAEMMVLIFDRSEVEYNLTKFNCEHFACYCATGLAFSGQTSYENIDATETLDKM
ncbi:unnamed protein product [Mytilus coruscus]|uniref:LRAT domain-containing protein n=1 Tax=Mytilus coruscus TaxID=42192 RepID=A0A6J8AEB8_MYTCO|nr:unnamed protein product [Mytilus coruscus]